MSGCSLDTQEKHLEIIHAIDMRLEKLTTLQEITTNNIDKLTSDIKETMCNKNSCNALGDKIRIIESKIANVTEYNHNVEEVKSKVDDMWFFVFAGRNPKLVGLMLIGLYAMAISDVRTFIFKLAM